MVDRWTAEPRSPLTLRQAEIFNWMVKFTHEHFCQPTIREIGMQFGIRSPNGVMCHLRGLAHKGLIELSRGNSRAVVFHRRTPLGTVEAYDEAPMQEMQDA